MIDFADALAPRRLSVAEEMAAAFAAATAIVSDQAKWDRYRNDPIGFIEGVLGDELTAEQKAICLSVRDRRETDVQAPHGVGKTFVASRLAVWWARCRGKVITTAPKKEQVVDLLWAEVRKVYGKHADLLGGTCLTTKLEFDGSHVATGFTSNEKRSDSFAGRHDANLLAIEDEASGISQDIDDGFDSCISGSGNRGLRIGNPLREGTPFHKHCQRGGTLKMTAFTHPNVAWAYDLHSDGQYRLKPDVAARLPRDAEGYILEQEQWPDDLPRDQIKGAVTIAWIEKHRKDGGEDSSFWASRIMGEFPETAINSLLPRNWFEDARARYDEDPEHWDKIAAQFPWHLGLDIGDGGDPHAYALRRGPVLYTVQEVATKGDRLDIDRAVTLALELIREKGEDTMLHVDRNGVGASVPSGVSGVTITTPAQNGMPPRRWNPQVDPVNNGDAANDAERYENVRAEDYWRVREMARKQELVIAPLGRDEGRAKDEFAAHTYDETAKGKIKIEPKKTVKVRLHRSPNLADAVVMAFRQTQAWRPLAM